MSTDKERADETRSAQEPQSPQTGDVEGRDNNAPTDGHEKTQGETAPQTEGSPKNSPKSRNNREEGARSEKKENKSKEYTEFSVTDTLDAHLRDYMEKKSEIPYYVWRGKMLQADYLLVGDNTHYVALAFENDSLGFNMRIPGPPVKDRMFGKNDITTIRGIGTESCAVFRNCMDYFSYKVINPDDKVNCIILNAPSNIGKVLSVIGKYNFWKVDVYMSASKKGDQCTKAITEVYSHARDCRWLFKDKGMRTYQEFYLSRREQTLF